MNEKNQIPSLNGGAHLSRIPYKLNQLPYKPIITLAVDKLTQSIIGFSIHEIHAEKNLQTHTRQLKDTSINWVRNAIAHHFSGNPGYFNVDSSSEFSNASYVKAFKELSLQPKLAWDTTVVGSIKIKHILEDIFVTLSLPLRGHPRPSPKNPPLGELWRQRGRRFPRI
ncbi:hypothetical protein [Pseudomonas sp. A-B-19]|uniref:hypothetical protein n=1 Tax=Pseudomonas sp. A-B-19 TaxID=2832405 RepID=UPI001CBAE559|nr:hypothetical protein [Pseudomonas sp. A-B-19]